LGRSIIQSAAPHDKKDLKLHHSHVAINKEGAPGVPFIDFAVSLYMVLNSGKK
jgi:hypothetical protein